MTKCSCKTTFDHGVQQETPNSYGSYSTRAPHQVFEHYCAKGWSWRADAELHEVFPAVRPGDDGYNLIVGNPIKAAADYYLLEAIMSGLLGREAIPTDFTHDYLWRRQQEHPFNRHGLKLCGCPAGTATIVHPCEHDGRISEFSWHLFNGTNRMPDHLVKMMKKAEKLQDLLVARWTTIFWSYGALAFASEATYVREMAYKFHDRNGYFSRNTMLGGLAAIERQYGPECWATEMYDLFSDQVVQWAGAYGGDAWRSCVRPYKLLAANEITPKLFVDRVFSAQHNTSTFLNKVMWYKNDPTYDPTDTVYVGDIKWTLNAHANSNYNHLLDECSKPVKALWSKYWDHINYERTVMRGLPVVIPEGTW